MASLEFVLMDDCGFRTYQSWFADEDLRRRVNPPTRRWFDYVRRTPGYHAWIVQENGAPVGCVLLEIAEDGIGYVEVVVRPDLRGRRYGKRILRDLLDRPEARSPVRLEAGVEADNLASRRLAEGAGFVAQSNEPDEHGFLHYVYITPPRA